MAVLSPSPPHIEVIMLLKEETALKVVVELPADMGAYDAISRGMLSNMLGLSLTFDNWA